MTPQQSVGHYRIIAKLGEGGMGEVWRAMDTKLGREVAVKILPAAFANDPDRIGRLQREAQVLASLNHSHIAAIYGVEQGALVMELVPGRTLAERIAEGPIPFDEALPVVLQIAEALEYAHERGIVHRDLKPANIKLTPQGDVKVLDFGLAKIAEERTAADNTADSPTLTIRATQAGVIIGTAAYMAPEQARGQSVDRRADIWAFGVVLYEMLSGKRLIDESSVSETLAAVLKGELNTTALPTATPPRVRRLIDRCLIRDPRQRLRDIGEARILLESPGEPDRSAPSRLPAPTRSRRTALILACGGIGAVLASAAAGWYFGRASTPAPDVARLSVTLPVPLGAVDYDMPMLAISPDGRTLAFSGKGPGGNALYLRPLRSADVRMVPGSEGALNPAFSPDGTWITFSVGQTIKKAPVAAGMPTPLASSAEIPFGADWTEDGSLYFSPGIALGIARVPAAGGEIKVLLRPDPAKGESNYLWPRLVPGTSDLLFAVNSGGIASMDDARIVVESIGKPESRQALATGSYPSYIATGHLAFFSGGSLMAAPYDRRTRRLTGAPEPVSDGIFASQFTGAVQAAISSNGTLVYAPAWQRDRKTRLVTFDLEGREQPLSDFQPMLFSDIALAPDGRRVAIRVSKANDDIHIFDIDRASLTRFTYESGDEQNPVWSPDGKRLAYVVQLGTAAHMFWKSVEGNSAPEPIQDSRYAQRPGSFSPDGRYLAYTELHPQTLSDLWTVRLEPGSPPRAEPFLRTAFTEEVPTFSPDGHWIAYQSDETGQLEVYVAQFPGASTKRQVSTDGGVQPMWAPDGKRLFFLHGKQVMSADWNSRGMQPGRSRKLFDLRFHMPLTIGARTSAVFPDGKRLLFVEQGDQPEVRELTVVINWFEQLRHKVK